VPFALSRAVSTCNCIFALFISVSMCDESCLWKVRGEARWCELAFSAELIFYGFLLAWTWGWVGLVALIVQASCTFVCSSLNQHYHCISILAFILSLLLCNVLIYSLLSI
jgi:hypothetical protein